MLINDVSSSLNGRWNVLGCQGSLLTHWMKPLYFATIVVGSK
jgi:hypothetical protein